MLMFIISESTEVPVHSVGNVEPGDSFISHSPLFIMVIIPRRNKLSSVLKNIPLSIPPSPIFICMFSPTSAV